MMISNIILKKIDWYLWKIKQKEICNQYKNVIKEHNGTLEMKINQYNCWYNYRKFVSETGSVFTLVIIHQNDIYNGWIKNRVQCIYNIYSRPSQQKILLPRHYYAKKFRESGIVL